MYYACNEHIEVAIDMVVDEQELAPIVDKISENKEVLSTTCSFCENVAIYSVDTL
ncbi:CxxH/CxxC protein [Halalkalibacter kiskunsagensis]|uniref:CxxH/CxxC protein n=1 Tax=Halalkalibacter kiskunsagensis TaxID=1548599 RepID=A0ABV6KE48_9BACI